MNMYPNIIPQQQILQANGKQSINNIRMYPNSSALIADTTAPIVWKCVSDSLGNVTAEPFDISPHKDEEQIEQENILSSIDERLKRLESDYESIVKRLNDTKVSADRTGNQNNKKSTGSNQ